MNYVLENVLCPQYFANSSRINAPVKVKQMNWSIAVTCLASGMQMSCLEIDLYLSETCITVLLTYSLNERTLNSIFEVFRGASFLLVAWQNPITLCSDRRSSWIADRSLPSDCWSVTLRSETSEYSVLCIRQESDDSSILFSLNSLWFCRSLAEKKSMTHQ